MNKLLLSFVILSSSTLARESAYGNDPLLKDIPSAAYGQNLNQKEQASTYDPTGTKNPFEHIFNQRASAYDPDEETGSNPVDQILNQKAATPYGQTDTGFAEQSTAAERNFNNAFALPDDAIKDNSTAMSSMGDPKVNQAKKKQSKAMGGEQLVPFSFVKRSLVDIINFLAEKRKVNIILPQLAVDAESIKNQVITFEPQGTTEIPLKEAWSLLTMFLELSGFSLVPKNPKLYSITRTGRPEEGGVTRDTLPLYVGTPPEKLPKSEQRIRYIYYLRNLKTPSAEDKDTNPLARIFREMLSPGAPVIPEPKSNGFIVIDRADIIASVMTIIQELDASGFRETIQGIPIYNLPARDIVRVFDSLRKAAGESPPTPFIRNDSRADISYFAADTKLVADDRTNYLYIMGRQTAVERITDFVHGYIDLPQETGKSILHTYNLQYLDAQSFASVLQNIVAPAAPGAQAFQGPPGGPERAFQGVVVAAEEIKSIDVKSTTEEVSLDGQGEGPPTGIEGKIFTGGNRLIIAAIQDDWIRLKDLIQSLDKPQPQVILEVMIADISTTREKLIAGAVRNPTNVVSNSGVQFLSTGLTPAANVLNSPPTKLATDLLTLIGAGPPASVASFLSSVGDTPGSMIVSINDPRTPGIAALLQTFDQQMDLKVLSYPHLVSTNNQKATIASQIIKRAQGNAVPGAAGVTEVPIVDVPATLQVQMIPRLSSLERLGLQIAIDILQFATTNATDLTRLVRRVNVNANLSTGQVLVIGGLTQITTNDVITETPILSRIPFFGNFFRSIDKMTVKTNLALFIAPTIVQPKLRGGLNLYTTDKVRKGRRDVANETIFSDLRDPITHVYFNRGPRPDSIIEQYMAQTTNAPLPENIITAKERRLAARRPRKRPIRQLNAPPQPEKATVAAVAA